MSSWICSKNAEYSILTFIGDDLVGSWVINNKFLMCFDDEKKILMKSKTFELKKNTLESLELRNKAVKATHAR